MMSGILSKDKNCGQGYRSENGQGLSEAFEPPFPGEQTQKALRLLAFLSLIVYWSRFKMRVLTEAL